MSRRGLFLVMLFLAAAPLQAQLQTIDIRGQVKTADEVPARAARVLVLDRWGAVLAHVESDDRGRFVFRHLPGGDYWLRAETDSMRSPMQSLSTRSGPPAEITLHLAPQTQETVQVLESATAQPDARITMAGETVRRLGGRLRTRALQTTIATMPGWSGEDSGLLHFRGVDDGFLFVLDGVPIYERLDPRFGLAPDAATLGSVQLLDGYVPPEYGLRSGGVVELRSASGDGTGWGGSVDASLASFATASASAVARGTVGARGTLLLSAGGERSNRFLDPVDPGNFHNQGATGNLAGEYLRAGDRDVVSVRAGGGGSSYEVPHDEAQEEAGQDQRQNVHQAFTTASWQRSWSPRTASHAAVYARWTSADLEPSAGDTPLSVESDRAQRRFGLLLAVTHARGAHTLKAGLEAADLSLREHFRFEVRDAEGGAEAGLSEAALAYSPEQPFDFRDRVRRPQYSLYAQDSWRASPRLTVDAGLRFDHTRLLLHEQAFSPRLGASYRFGHGATVLRAALNRFFQPPQPEYLLLASSPEARTLSPFADQGGGADVPAERQTALQLMLEQKLGPARLDLAVWQRRIQNQADPNVLFGTNIVFPNSVARGRAEGLDVRLSVPPARRWSGYVSYTLSRVVQFGPINGGLFLEDDFPDIGPGTEFIPDHDQRHVASAAVTYQDEHRGRLATMAAHYQSGTPLETGDDGLADLASRPGSDLVDLATGRVKPYLVVDATVAVRVKRWSGMDLSGTAAVLNLTGTRYAFNFGNPFSGTHFGAPRAVMAGLRLTSR